MKKHIRKLLISGSITTDPYGIPSEQKRFYEDLYKAKTIDSDHSVKTSLNNLNIPQLSEKQKLSCERGISTEECKKILETFENNKSP